MRKIGKLMSLALALAMCLMLALPALAADEEPLGSDDPVGTAEEESVNAPAEPASDEIGSNDPEAPEETPEPQPEPEPAADGDSAADPLQLVLQALKYLVGLPGAERPDPEEMQALGGGLIQAVISLLTADPGADPGPQPTHTPEPTATPKPTPAPETVLIAVVPDAETVEDNSLNQAAFIAVQAWTEEHEGYDAAAYTPTENELKAEETPTLPAMRRACGAGADIVICTGFGHGGSIQQAAKEYPDVRFLFLDSALDDESLTNIAAVTFAVEQCGYAAGYAAVTEGYTKLGFLGGLPVSDVLKYGFGFIQGVKDAAAEKNVPVTLEYDYAWDFAPSDHTKEMAEKWYNDGVQVIFGCAGGGNLSIGQATDACGAKMIGVDVAPTDAFPGIITSALKDVGTAAVLLLDRIHDGAWDSVGGKTTLLSAADGIELLPASPWRMQTFTKEKYDALLAELVNGSRTVDPNAPEDVRTLSDDRVTIHVPMADPPTADELMDDAFIDPRTEWGQYDDLIAEIKAETDKDRRTELMHQAEDILMATGCVVPIYYYTDLYLLQDDVTGVYDNPYGFKWFMYARRTDGGDALRISLATEPDTLDPALNSSVDGACLAANSFSGLYTYNADGQCVPACADSYVMSDDGLTWTVTLKEGLKWSDGSDLTAADFAYAWKRAASEDTAADYGYLFAGFEGYPNELAVTAADARTLTFTLTAPCAYMEDLMAFPAFYPVKQSAVEASADWCAEAGFVSNGAYVCTGWEHGVSMTYEKNPYWYDADRVTVRTLVFDLEEDESILNAAYSEGRLDFLDNVTGDAAEANGSELHVVDELGTYYYSFNAGSALFDGMTPAEAACVRKAVTILIDRSAIVEALGGRQAVADSFIPLGMADGSGGLFKDGAPDGYYDAYAVSSDREIVVSQAVTLLTAAGYEFGEDGKLSEETPLRIDFIANNGSGHAAIAEAVKNDLAALGIEMTVRQLNWNVFLENRRAGSFDLARGGWIADFNDPINMLEMWTSDSGNNDCHFGS